MSHCLLLPFKVIDAEDSIWCSLSLSDCNSMLIGLAYRSLNSSDDNNDKLLHLMQNLPYIHPYTTFNSMSVFVIQRVTSKRQLNISDHAVTPRL